MRLELFAQPCRVPLMTDHDVTGVEYVPVCDQCWEAVQLTEADDGTFVHIPRSVPTSVEKTEDLYQRRAREYWIDRFGKPRFEATWIPEAGVMHFLDEFYDGKLDQLGPLPTVERHGDQLTVQDYDGRYIVLEPDQSFWYGLRDS